MPTQEESWVPNT